jgi:hypothetical protein
MADHWKHRATRCAVEGCERTRVKGHSTCSLLTHHRLGKPLAGAGKIEPIPPPEVCETSITYPGPTVYRNGPIPTRDVAGEWDRRDEEGQ